MPLERLSAARETVRPIPDPTVLSRIPNVSRALWDPFTWAVQIVTPCFDDWKRFCRVLREIASGENGRPLPSFQAQKRAQAVLIECGYTWPGQTVAPKPIAAPDRLSEPENEVEKPPRKGKRDTR